MKIEIIKCLQDNYSYLIIDDENQTACVIDPSESAPIINYLKRLLLHEKCKFSNFSWLNVLLSATIKKRKFL